MRLRALLPVAVLVSAAVAPPALAQPSPAQIEAAKKTAAEAADKALDAFDAGKFADAIAGFQAADRAFHAPKFQLYIARSQTRMGKLAAAKETYEAIVREKLPVFAPPEFFTAQADAKKELGELSPRVPTLEVQAKGGIERAALDGKAIPLGQPVPVDPGEHTLTGNGSGVPEARLVLTVQEREKKTAVLQPAATPPPATTTAPDPSSSGDDTAPPNGGGALSRAPVPAMIAYGAGAVGLLMGGVFSGMTLAKKGEYDALRQANPVDAREVNAAAADGRTFAAVADVGFIVAVVGAAAGTVVWIVTPKPKEAPKEGLNTVRSLFVAPRAGGLTVGGSF